MRNWLTLLLLLAVAGCGANEVKRLDLRDPRLPIEARRWLADAEDEVAIARARVDDIAVKLRRLEGYRGELEDQLKGAWSSKKGGAPTEGAKAAKAFLAYADSRIELAELELEAAQQARSLAWARLVQARAETAIRYDLAIYEIEPITLQVEELKDEVAAAQRQVEQQRALVEHNADTIWQAYRKYVVKGGETSGLWGSP